MSSNVFLMSNETIERLVESDVNWFENSSERVASSISDGDVVGWCLHVMERPLAVFLPDPLTLAVNVAAKLGYDDVSERFKVMLRLYDRAEKRLQLFLNASADYVDEEEIEKSLLPDILDALTRVNTSRLS
jgi:hypothetical protein